MATTTWTLSKDTTTAGGAVDYGNGADQHAPIGLWSGWTYRHFAKYAVSTTGMATISAATLYMRSTGQQHVAFGSSPTILVSRVTSNWTGSGGSESSWSGSASPKRSTEPSVTTTGQTTTNATEVENSWDTFDVTAIAQAWLAGSTNYGIRMKAASEASTADTWEGYAQASSYDSYIKVTYTATSTAHDPTVTAISPETGDVADAFYTAGALVASPRPLLTWAYSDIDGDAQASYQVIVYTDSGGSPDTTLWDSGQVTSAATSVTPVATFDEGDYYHWKVKVWDSTGADSAYTSTERFRMRWGFGEYIRDLTVTPTTWEVTSIASTGSVAIEYNSTSDTDDPGTDLGTWAASLASVTKRRYMRYRVWLLPQNSVAPSLESLTLSYSADAVPTPDNWTLSADGSIDTATRVYGTKSLRIETAGADQRTYQLVTVQPNTTYQLHGRIQQSAVGANGYFALGTTTSGGEVARADASAVYTDWTEVGTSWNSGANTSIYVHCGAEGTGTTWFDAVKLEASEDPTVWMPSLLSGAVVIDASGILIDGSLGGSLRLRGSDGDTRDEVQLNEHGLLFGGDTTLYSSDASVLKTDDSLAVGTALQVGGEEKFIQTGTATVTLSAASTGTEAVVFDTAFDNVPIVLVTRIAAGTSKLYCFVSGTTSETGFTMAASTGDGASVSSTVTGQWLAIDMTKLF